MTAALVVVVGYGGAAIAAGPPQHAGPTQVFATDTGTGGHLAKAIPGVAATVDGHPIAMNDVVILALRNDRSYIVDQMIQNFVVDRDCKRRGIVVPEAEIDKRIEQLRKALAPKTLEAEIKDHNSSMADVRYAFRQQIARSMLVEDQIKPTKMLHCQAIMINFCPDGATDGACTTKRTEPEAIAALKGVEDKLKQGVSFASLATQYSEIPAPAKDGDMGVLFDGVHDVDAAVLHAALAINKGETTPDPVKMESRPAYCLIQAVSSENDHPKADDALYKDAIRTYHDQQSQFLGPKYVVDMIEHSKVWTLTDKELLSAKTLPRAAATVDGQPILLKDVTAKCMASDGARCTNILVESYVVDRECKRRGITATKAEIDAHIDDLAKQIAPHTMAEALQVHHTTMTQLRHDFEQQIKRAKLVEDQVASTRMVHCRVILLKDTQDPSQAVAQPASIMTPSPAQSAIADIQAQLKAGADFAQLAKQHPVDGTDGDIGILFPGIQQMDTALLNAGLALKTGQTTPEPVKTVDGWCLVQAVSTSDDHPKTEDTAYNAALSKYKEQEAQMREPEFIMNLIKKSKVVYFLHA